MSFSHSLILSHCDTRFCWQMIDWLIDFVFFSAHWLHTQHSIFLHLPMKLCLWFAPLHVRASVCQWSPLLRVLCVWDSSFLVPLRASPTNSPLSSASQVTKCCNNSKYVTHTHTHTHKWTYLSFTSSPLSFFSLSLSWIYWMQKKIMIVCMDACVRESWEWGWENCLLMCCEWARVERSRNRWSRLRRISVLKTRIWLQCLQRGSRYCLSLQSAFYFRLFFHHCSEETSSTQCRSEKNTIVVELSLFFSHIHTHTLTHSLLTHFSII
jgi:hypothetical protein